MPEQFIFDSARYQRITTAREASLVEVLPELRERMGLKTALDIGCGLGHFSAALQKLGFSVVGADGRESNVLEARQRFPEIDFRVADVEEKSSSAWGSYDLVLCLGLLYHLENPMRAIRNLEAMSGKLLIVEGMCVSEGRPALYLLDEGRGEDQSLNGLAFYPSESGLIKMLYRSGFAHVWRLARLPDFPDFRSHARKKRGRTMLIASRLPLSVPSLVRAEEPACPWNLWTTRLGRVVEATQVGWRFAARPWPQKLATLRRRFARE